MVPVLVTSFTTTTIIFKFYLLNITYKDIYRLFFTKLASTIDRMFNIVLT